MRVSSILLLLALLLPPGTLLRAREPGAGRLAATLRLAYDTTRTPGSGFLPAREPLRPRLALVLSGGGARGAAQIGVLKAFRRNGIPIDFIAATSMGAIIGGLYASGYSVAEIESLTLHSNWDEILSLNDEARRKDLFIEQKLARDRTFLAVRFQGLEPVIPSAVASGQQLTDWLNIQTLQALYHADPDFDHLKVPFRAIATDLISGKRVVMGSGSLAEAIRASATTPLLFNPIERDSMRLIDGGLLANVPVDVARERGVDAVIAVNTTSGLRTIDELNAPWQTVDQMMSISMQVFNTEQLRNADVVITPNIGRHLTFDLHGLDTLIALGEQSAEERIPAIRRLLDERAAAMDPDTSRYAAPASVDVEGPVSDSLKAFLECSRDSAFVSARGIRRNLRLLFASGVCEDAYAEVWLDSIVTRLRYVVRPNPLLKEVVITGCRQVSPDSLARVFSGQLGLSVNRHESVADLEEVLRIYRTLGYSLARIDTVSFDTVSGRLRIAVNEGILDSINVEGGERTQDDFILKEFEMEKGDVFRIDRANRGVANIISTTLFEYVYLEVTYPGRRTDLAIRLRERPSQLMRLGLRADNERHLQGLLDIRDENFQGSGMELGLTLSGGDRNADVNLGYMVHRLFGAYFTLSADAFYRTFDTYLFADAAQESPDEWRRVQVGEYRDIRYGASVGFSSQFERLGKVSLDLLVQNVRLKNLQNAASLEERYRLVMIQGGTVVDSKDAYPFPTSGVGFTLNYEFAVEGLGSELGFNSMRLMYEWYTTWGGRHTIHPRIIMDFADRTLPLSQQFRLGGRDSFFGLREDDRRGRQLMLANLEYRYFLPVRLLFDTYLRIRYDLGSVSALPEDLKFSTLRHGVGTEICWRTPVGPASVGVGKSFYLNSDLPNTPVAQGPLLWYFMIGYQL